MTSPSQPGDSGRQQEPTRPARRASWWRGPSLDATLTIARRRWRWLTVFAAFALCVVFTAFFLSRSTGTRTEAGTLAGRAVSTSPAVSASPAASASRVASGRRVASAHREPTGTPEAVAASRHVPPKIASLLRNWDAGPGGSALAKVSNALGSASQDAGAGLYSPMRLECLNLGAAVTAARAAPAIPDAAMQGWYRRALATLAMAAADCRTGIAVFPYGDEDVKTRENPTLLRQSVGDLATGARYLYQATEEINTVRVQAKHK